MAEDNEVSSSKITILSLSPKLGYWGEKQYKVKENITARGWYVGDPAINRGPRSPVKLFCHARQNFPKERVKARNEFSRRGLTESQNKKEK